MIRNRNIAARTKRLWLDIQTFSGRSVDRLSMLGAGAPVYQEPVAAAELAGLAIAAAGDEAYTMLPIPWDLDRNEPIRVRIWFSHSTTTADTPDWLVNLKYLGKQIVITDAKSSPDETLTFAAAAVSTTADALEVLDFEESESHKNMAETDFAIMIAVEANGLGGAGANEITLYGIELEYTLGGLSEGNRLVTSEAPAGDTRVDSGADYYI